MLANKQTEHRAVFYHVHHSFVTAVNEQNSPQLWISTSNNTTAQSRDALDLCHIVLQEVVVTQRTAHVPLRTELLRQLTGHCEVSHRHSFSTYVELISHQSPVSQHADPTAITQTKT